MAEELVTLFAEDAEVLLSPSHGGVFDVREGSALLFRKDDEGRFPNAGEIVSRLQS